MLAKRLPNPSRILSRAVLEHFGDTGSALPNPSRILSRAVLEHFGDTGSAVPPALSRPLETTRVAEP
jgi:hypothetical protein